MICTHSSQCDLYVQFAAEPALALWKKRYCNSKYNQCARYQCAARNQLVPMTLLPNGTQLGEARDKEDITLSAVFNAISKNRCHMVQSIIKASPGAQHGTNSDGVSALMLAAKLGNPKMLNVLLLLGCDPTRRNKLGQSALDISQQFGYKTCLEILQTAEKKALIGQARRRNTSSSPDSSTNKTSILSRMLHFLRGHKPPSTHKPNY